MIALSTLAGRLRRMPEWPEIVAAARGNPALAGARIAAGMLHMGPVMVNVGALLAAWWGLPRRVAWRLGPASAAEVAATGVGYLPPEPPQAWQGAAILAESADGAPLVQDVFSVGAYAAPHHQSGRPYYWFVALDTAGGAGAWGVPCSQERLNARLAREGALIEVPLLRGDDWGDLAGQRPYTPAEQLRMLAVMQWVVALSYYLSEPGTDWRTAPSGDGPPERDGRGKVLRAGGRPVPWWTYRDLQFDARREPPADERGALDTTNLVLLPTLVRAHWRRLADGRLTLVRMHPSRRWRRPDGG